jgi:hypothetical protein
MKASRFTLGRPATIGAHHNNGETAEVGYPGMKASDVAGKSLDGDGSAYANVIPI